MSSHDIDDPARTAFEDAYLATYHADASETFRKILFLRDRFAPDEYEDSSVARAWSGWQLCTAYLQGATS